MKVNDVILQSHEKPDEPGRVFGIVNVVRIRLSMPCDIDHRTWNASAEKKIANCNQVTLNAPVRRRIRAELKHLHAG